MSDRTEGGPGRLPLPFFRGVLARPADPAVSPTVGVAVWDLAQGYGLACEILGRLEPSQGHSAAAVVWVAEEHARALYQDVQRIAEGLDRANPGVRVLARLDLSQGLGIVLLEVRRG